MTILAEPIADLSDLDLLEDESAHGYCDGCNGPYAPGVPFVAICGKRVVDFGPLTDVVPLDACIDCLAFIGQPCPRCGA